jgi:hypothetical protein
VTEFGPAFDALLADLKRVRSQRLWAAFMLSRQVEVLNSILLGKPVRCGLLDRLVLRRALRGGPLPPAESYMVVTDEHLDAIAEAGPLEAKRR